MKLKINKYFWNVIFVIQISLLTMILFFINRNKILITKRNVLFFIGLALLIIISFVLIIFLWLPVNNGSFIGIIFSSLNLKIWWGVG